MTLAELLKHARSSYVVVRDSLSGDCLYQGTDSSVLHSASCEDYIVEYFTAAYYTEPIIYVEVL